MMMMMLRRYYYYYSIWRPSICSQVAKVLILSAGSVKKIVDEMTTTTSLFSFFFFVHLCSMRERESMEYCGGTIGTVGTTRYHSRVASSTSSIPHKPPYLVRVPYRR